MIKIPHSILLKIATKVYSFADTSKTAKVPYNLIKISCSSGKISATCSNYNIIAIFSASVDCDEDFSFVTNAFRFFDVIKNWHVSEEINFQIFESKVVLKNKSKKVTIACVEDEGYWDSRKASTEYSFFVDSKDLKKIAESVAFCSSKTAYDITHRCLLLQSMENNEILFAAQEGFRLASVIVKNESLSGSFRSLVDAETFRSAIRMLNVDEVAYVHVQDSRVDIFDSNTWIGIATVPAKYPDILRVRGMQYPYRYIVESKDIEQISKSVLSVIRNTDRPRNARLTVSNNALVFFAATEDGDIEDSIPLNIVESGPFDDSKGCDIIYFAEPTSMFEKLELQTSPDRKHGYIFTTDEMPGWLYHLLATK